MRKFKVARIRMAMMTCGGVWVMNSAVADMQQDLQTLGNPSAQDIVGHCANKNIDKDLTAKMTIVNGRRNGEEKKNVYQRHVINAQGADDVVEKMLLQAEYPPESVGTAFLRWEYTDKSGKYPDQWLYSPSLRKVRKISVRDEQERFLGSTLTLGDIAKRDAARDQHALQNIEKRGDVYRLVVESTPKAGGSAYGKWVSTFVYDGEWANCRVEKIEYFDQKGFLQKVQKNQWQKVGGTWAWQHVEVENLQSQEISTFELEDVKVNTGLSDEMFSERQLRRAK